jgi:hypothetical protein
VHCNEWNHKVYLTHVSWAKYWSNERIPDSKLANHKTINEWIELQIMFAWFGVKQGGNWVADFMPDSNLVNLQTQKIAGVLLRVWNLHTSFVYPLKLFTKSNCPRYRVDQIIIDHLPMTEQRLLYLHHMCFISSDLKCYGHTASCSRNHLWSAEDKNNEKITRQKKAFQLTKCIFFFLLLNPSYFQIS